MKIIKDEQDWEVLKYKLMRKFNSLSPSELVYNPDEDATIIYLEKRLCKTRGYIEFMLKKMLYYKKTNTL
ncbi:MAG: hypothetical protein ACQPRJ_02075 [Solitalea-like symbiont of Acarus siro]